VYNNVALLFLNYSLHKIATLLQKAVFKAIATVRPKHLLGSLNRLNERHFKSKHTVQLFNRYATYNGSNPYKAPGMLSLIPHLEYNEGVFYPKGGMVSITNALYQLALKKGVQFRFNCSVSAITHHQKIATGVVAEGQIFEADAVISNVDVYFTYKNLLQNNVAAQKILTQERSSSALIFYWGIKQPFPQLELHNIYFSYYYKAEFDSLFVHKNLYHDPTVYINITGKCEPSIQAPTGCENWFVMINTPANVGQNWPQFREQAKQAIITKLNRILPTDIAPLIEVEQVLDAVGIEQQTHSYMGSLYGTSSNSKMAAFLRHPNFSHQVRQLYFVGGSVHPGGGIPLCLKSAQIMSQIAIKELSKSAK
jgi:phytoene desaturase